MDQPHAEEDRVSSNEGSVRCIADTEETGQQDTGTVATSTEEEGEVFHPCPVQIWQHSLPPPRDGSDCAVDNVSLSVCKYTQN